MAGALPAPQHRLRLPGLPPPTQQDRVRERGFCPRGHRSTRHVVANQVPQVLDLVGLANKRDNLPGELSGGEQQRVAVARAFVNRPLILLADEPTGNLDPQTSQGIMQLLDRINRTGTTVVVATHDEVLVDKMRRRVIELSNGRMVRDQARGVYGFDGSGQGQEAV